MKAIRLDQPGCLSLVSVSAASKPGPEEALVRVHRVGVCGTDIHAYNGRQPFFSYPRILGHELGVEVVEIGAAVRNVRPGDHCAVEPYLNCGRCIACRSGKSNCCTNIRVLGVHTDGGMREEFTLPANKLHPSASLSLDQLALVETLGIGAHAVERARVQREEIALVIGAGPIGLAVTQFAIEAGARVIMLDVTESRLNFCRSKLGVAHTIDGTAENVLETLTRITDGELPTAVFDATGNARSMTESFDHVAHGGRLVFVGLFQGEVTFNDPQFHRRELTLLASRNSLPEDFTRIIRLLENGSVDTSPWITHRASFAEAVDEFSTWISPATGVIKAMLHP